MSFVTWVYLSYGDLRNMIDAWFFLFGVFFGGCYLFNEKNLVQSVMGTNIKGELLKTKIHCLSCSCMYY